VCSGVNTGVTFFMRDPLLADGDDRAAMADTADVAWSESSRVEVEEWFEELYRSQRSSVVRLVRLLTGSDAQAEDLAHEAFLRVYRRDAPIDEPVSFLRAVTVNVCRNWHRGRQREQLRVVRHGPDADRVSPQARELDASLGRLPYQERAVIVLRYWLDLSEAEIARTLECRPGTVKSRHSRALRKLNKELSQ
jgi:RNA polymerase sigma factor (sigma-70 family)